MNVFSRPIVDRKIRFALVGCGRIAKNHFDAIQKLNDQCDLVDVCDINADALTAATASTGARGHASLTDMLAATDADCVILTTPSGLHSRQTDHRAAVITALKEQGIPTAAHYPRSRHRQPAYASPDCPAESFPHSNAAADRVMSSPMSADISDEDQRRVVEALTQALR